MPDGFFRVFWISSIWLPTALFWAPAAVRRPMARTAVQLALLAGIFVSYSRGIWLGLAAGAMLASVAGLRPGEVARGLVRRAMLVGVALAVLIAGAAATGQLDRVTDRSRPRRRGRWACRTSG
jgi:nitric oxide reductase large subunit